MIDYQVKTYYYAVLYFYDFVSRLSPLPDAVSSQADE